MIFNGNSIKTVTDNVVNFLYIFLKGGKLMGKFDPRSLTREVLDEAVRTGRLSSYYLNDGCLIKEIKRADGGYKLSLIEYVDNTKKQHVMCDYIYDETGRLVDYRIHK